MKIKITAVTICIKPKPERTYSEKKLKETHRIKQTQRFICSSDIRNIKRITGHFILIVSNMLTVQQTQQTHRHRYTQ